MPFQNNSVSKLILLSVLFLFFCNFSIAQSNKITLHGYVRDITSGEELIGVTVYFPEIKKGIVTNAYGFYSITIEKGTYLINFSYVGYNKIEQTLVLIANKELTIELQPAVDTIPETVAFEP